MKNKSANGLVAVIISLLFIGEGVGPFVGICLAIYGLWSARNVLKEKEKNKRDRVVAIITSVIGYPIVLVLFVIFFVNIFK